MRKSVTYPELCKRQFRCNKRLFLGVTWRQEPYSNYFHFAVFDDVIDLDTSK